MGTIVPTETAAKFYRTSGVEYLLGLNNWDPKATFVDIKLEGAMLVRPINGYGMSFCCFTSFPAPTQQGLGYE